MSDPIENLLRAMPLKKPSAGLDARVRAAMGGAEPPADESADGPADGAAVPAGPRAVASGRGAPVGGVPARRAGRAARWVAWAGLGALAAAVMAAVWLSGPRPPAAPPGPALGGAPGAAVGAAPGTGPGVRPGVAPEAAAGADEPEWPVVMSHNWTRTAYEGLVAPDADTPLRRFRRQTFDVVRWTDPDRGLEMETTFPREEVILIKAQVN